MREKCILCGKEMNSWDVRLSKTLKCGNRCEECLCGIYGFKQEAFRAKMEAYFDIRPCRGI